MNLIFFVNNYNQNNLSVMLQPFRNARLFSAKHSLLFLFLLMFLCSYVPIYAQSCSSTAQDTLQTSNIDAVISLGPRLFYTDHFSVASGPDAPGGSTIYAAALWMAGLAPNGQYRLSIGEYGSANTPAGPLNNDNTTDSLIYP